VETPNKANRPPTPARTQNREAAVLTTADKALISKVSAQKRKTDPLNLEALFESGPSTSASSSNSSSLLSGGNLEALLARIAELEKGARNQRAPEPVQAPEPVRAIAACGGCDGYDPEEPELFAVDKPRYKIPKLTVDQKIDRILSDLNSDIIKCSKRAVYRINQLKKY